VSGDARQKRVERARMRVLFKVPFFAPALCRLPVEFSDDVLVSTACTDGRRIVWSRSWFDALDDKVLPTVLCHEVAHCLLGHLWRAPEGADWPLWNQACDHAVNGMLKDWSGQVMARKLADPFPFPSPETDYLMDPRFRGWSEERIYQSLLDCQHQGGGAKGGPGSMPEFGQMFGPAGPKDAAVAGKLETEWAATMAQSVAAHKGRGDLPGGLARFARELVSPVVPWWDIVRNWLREQAEDDWDWQRPNPYFDESGFILPSLHSERMGPIVFATDTSGSIEDGLLTRFRSEKQNCLDEMRPSRLLDIYCDESIRLEREYRAGDEIGVESPGGGGTRFDPVFERLELLEGPPRCLVYLTDLRGTFPAEAPGYPVLWVVWGGCSSKAPFGDTIHID
jgi:predicted metal-dependent peptidase